MLFAGELKIVVALLASKSDRQIGKRTNGALLPNACLIDGGVNLGKPPSNYF